MRGGKGRGGQPPLSREGRALPLPVRRVRGLLPAAGGHRSVGVRPVPAGAADAAAPEDSGPVILRRMQAKLAEALYYRYDTARPWAEQFEANLAWLAGQRARLEEMQRTIDRKNR